MIKIKNEKHSPFSSSKSMPFQRKGETRCDNEIQGPSFQCIFSGSSVLSHRIWLPNSPPEKKNQGNSRKKKNLLALRDV